MSAPNMATRASSGDPTDREAIPGTGSGRRSRPTGLRSWLGSWLVPVRQKIALLFPAEPETRRRIPVVVIVPAYLLMIAVGAGALLLRQAGRPSWNTIWGEDGWLLLPGAISHPLSAILQPYAGYVQVFPRLTADLIALLPFRDAAAGFAIAGAVVAAAIGAFAYKACSGHVRNRAMRLMLGASVVLLPTGIIEVANSGINTPWYGLFALFWALIWRPRSWAGMIVVAFIGLAVMSSQIVGALLLPLLVARLIALPRVREHAVTFGYIAGAGFQVAGVLQANNGTQLSHPGRDWSFVVRHMLDVAAGGQHFTVWLLHHAGHSLGTALLCGFVAAIFAWALVLGNARVRAFSVAVAACAFLLSYLPALYRTKVTVPATGPLGHLWVRGDRYTVTPILIIISAMIIVADAALSREGSRLLWRRRRLQVTSAVAPCVLIACIIATWATDYRYIVARSYYASWSTSVDYAAQTCADGYHPYLSPVRAWVPCDWLDPNHLNGAQQFAWDRRAGPRPTPPLESPLFGLADKKSLRHRHFLPFPPAPQIERGHRWLVVVGGLNVTEGFNSDGRALIPDFHAPGRADPFHPQPCPDSQTPDGLSGTLDEIEGRWAKASDILPGFRQHAPSRPRGTIGCDGMVPKLR